MPPRLANPLRYPQFRLCCVGYGRPGRRVNRYAVKCISPLISWCPVVLCHRSVLPPLGAAKEACCHSLGLFGPLPARPCHGQSCARPETAREGRNLTSSPKEVVSGRRAKFHYPSSTVGCDWEVELSSSAEEKLETIDASC
jgi:hypothetical protein